MWSTEIIANIAPNALSHLQESSEESEEVHESDSSSDHSETETPSDDGCKEPKDARGMTRTDRHATSAARIKRKLKRHVRGIDVLINTDPDGVCGPKCCALYKPKLKDCFPSSAWH